MPIIGIALIVLFFYCYFGIFALWMAEDNRAVRMQLRKPWGHFWFIVLWPVIVITLIIKWFINYVKKSRRSGDSSNPFKLLSAIFRG